jgi:hypothetical protein
MTKYEELMEISILDFEDESYELDSYLNKCEDYLNNLLKGTSYKATIWETNNLYEDYEDHPESEYNGRPLFQGKVILDDEDETEIDDSLTGGYCEIFAVLEELDSFISIELLNEDNILPYENKQMGDFLELLGLSSEDITNLVVNGDKSQNILAIEKIKSKIIF